MRKFRKKWNQILLRTRNVLTDKRGEGYVDVGVTILISVVVGALLLYGLYSLFGDTIIPTLTQKIKDLFNYSGK